MSRNPTLDQRDDLTIEKERSLYWRGIADQLKHKYAALRAVLADAEELERYSGDGRRQWGRCSAWLHPDDAVIIISATALDAARKGAQP